MFALGSAHEKFGVWIKSVQRCSKRRNSRPSHTRIMPEPFNLKWPFLIDLDAELFVYFVYFRGRVLHSRNKVRHMKSLAYERTLNVFLNITLFCQTMFSVHDQRALASQLLRIVGQRLAYVILDASESTERANRLSRLPTQISSWIKSQVNILSFNRRFN